MKSHNIVAVFSRRDKLRDQLTDFCGFVLEGKRLDEFVTELSELLPEVPRAALFLSCQYLVGVVLTPEALFSFAWRLAGNGAELRAGRPVLPWQAQRGEEWVPLYVLTNERVLTPSGRPAVSLRLRVLAGSPCPMIVKKVWPTSFVFHVLSRELGFTPPWGERVFTSLDDLLDLRFDALFDPKYSWQDRPGFDKIRCRGAARQWNVETTRRRRGAPCPAFD